MEITGEMWNTRANIIERVISKFRQCALKKESSGMSSFVMKAQNAQDYQICEKNAEVEIRDGFNCNLVVQRYDRKKRIIVYIPCEWKNRIFVEVTEGKIFCRQKALYPGLHLSITRGEILCGEEVKESLSY